MSKAIKKGLGITKDRFMLKSDSEKYQLFMASLLLADSLKLRIKALETKLERQNDNKTK